MDIAYEQLLYCIVPLKKNGRRYICRGLSWSFSPKGGDVRQMLQAEGKKQGARQKGQRAGLCQTS